MNLKLVPLYVLFVLAAGVPALGWFVKGPDKVSQYAAAREPNLAAIFGGAAALNELRHADRFSFCRLDPVPSDARDPRLSGQVDYYPPHEDPRPLTADLGRSLVAILLRPATYDWNIVRKTGPPAPDLRISCGSPIATFDILLCRPSQRLLIYRDGRFVGKADLDANDPELAAWVALATQ